MHRKDFRCLLRLRVRWAEVDMQKIVFNGHYLTYIDTAMSEYWRAVALPYEAAMQVLGGEMVVKKATLEYHAPARVDDALQVGMRCAHLGNSSCRFIAAIFRDDKPLVSGEIVYVFSDLQTQTSRPIPAALRDIFADYEAGAEMVEVRTGDWNTLGRDATQLRMAVFVHEQGIPAEEDADAFDPTALHAVAYNRLGMPVATGRLTQESQGVARIGRMAVEHSVRGQQWGRRILEALLAAARARGDRVAQLHAQCSAEGFYRRAGFETVGAPYEEAGIAHVTMQRAL
ncbi:YbgC/FadM family acyl-CoA thioesterase [Extensimonas perlucida]|uniref:YbgC/FadM family acyl-CoA thioesterase n=1 Tax=Extensimonas perlucida TaxID=2590786 RepID=UPI0011A6521A|nr:YbgC/FadM family acyl-CoA thioesterase [Extensimonas perlucida]